MNKLQIRTSKPRVIWKVKTVLGESTLWVPNQNSIFFVDIKKKKIFKLNIKTKKKKIFRVNKEIGFLSHIKESIFLLGLKSELRIMNLKNKKIIFSIKIEPKLTNNRINDGKTDSTGRLWFGTMDSFERKKSSGFLYCLDNDLKLHKIDSRYYIPNGPAFLNKHNFYYADSRRRIVYKIKINSKFQVIKKSIFIKFKKQEGFPDGMTTDIKNNLWICHYNGMRVSVFNLKGKKIHQIYLPVKNVTNCTFGGIKNNELFISTARKDMSSKELKKYQLSGSLFRVKTNIKGKKTESFKILNSIF